MRWRRVGLRVEWLLLLLGDMAIVLVDIEVLLLLLLLTSLRRRDGVAAGAALFRVASEIPSGR